MLTDLLPGMHRAYARTGVPVLVRAPWPEPYAVRYTDLTCVLRWSPEAGYWLEEGQDTEGSAWRLRDSRWR